MKFCVFLSTCICFVIYGVGIPRSTQLETIADGIYSFYSTDRVESPYITNTIDLGFSYIYECQSTDASKVRQLLNRVDGESILFTTDISKRKILDHLGARIVSVSGFGIYAYTPRTNNYITNNNRKINIQIAQKGNKTVIGSPIILGSY